MRHQIAPKHKSESETHVSSITVVSGGVLSDCGIQEIKVSIHDETGHHE